jgi:hypothetical protein
MQHFELFHILEGQPCPIGFAESLEDAHAHAALLEGDYLVVDNTTGLHIRISKVVLRDAFDYAWNA